MGRRGSDSQRKRRFERIVGIYYRDLYRYAAWLCRNPDVAEVVLQETMLRAWRSLDSLRDDKASKQWLLTIVRRENARYFDGARREMVNIDDLTPGQEAMISTTDDRDLQEVREAIFQLDDGYREPLVLQVLMGYSTQEIADTMGLNRGAVLTRLHRARQKLRDTLDEMASSSSSTNRR